MPNDSSVTYLTVLRLSVHRFLLYVKASTVELVELFALSLRYRKVQFHEITQEIRYKQTKRQLNGGSMSVVRLM